MSSTMGNMLMRKARALFIAPPVYDFALYDLFLRPYGLLRVAGIFQQSDYEISFVDALDPFDRESAALYGGYPKRKGFGTGKFFRRPAGLPEGVEPVKRQFSRYGIDGRILESRLKECFDGGGPDVIGIGTGMTYWYSGVQEVAELCRSLWPEVPILAGGVYATLLPGHCESLAENLHALPGSLETGSSGRTMLDAILADRHLPLLVASLPHYPPLDIPGKGNGEDGRGVLHQALVRDGAAVIRLNRGCPFRCDYCASGILEPAPVPGEPDLLLNYVVELRKRGISHFAFYDDALLFHKERLLLPFLEGIAGSFSDLSFFTPNAMHLRLMDRETAVLMRRAGFRDLRFGYESDSQEFHREHDGKYEPREAEAAFRALKQAGFAGEEVLLYVLGGLPGQGRGELFQAIRSARESGFRVQVAEYSPVPGTSLWNESVRLARFPIAGEPLYQNNSFKPLAWEGLTEDDLEEAKRYARRKR